MKFISIYFYFIFVLYCPAFYSQSIFELDSLQAKSDPTESNDKSMQEYELILLNSTTSTISTAFTSLSSSTLTTTQSLKSVLSTPIYLSMSDSNGSKNSNDINDKESKGLTFRWIVVIVISSVLLVLSITLIIYFCIIRKRNKQSQRHSQIHKSTQIKVIVKKESSLESMEFKENPLYDHS